MGGVIEWFKSDWFNVVQAFCLIGGFNFAAKAWRIQFLTALAEKHRSVWEKIMGNPALNRIFAKEADLSKCPLTPDEEIALNIIIIHYETGWEVAKFLDRERLLPLANDISSFFRLPLVNAAWEKNKQTHKKRFVQFVSHALESTTPL